MTSVMGQFNPSKINSQLGFHLVTQFERVSTNSSLQDEDLPIDCNGVCRAFGIVVNLLKIYYIPSIILLGLVGNLLTFSVFLSSRYKMRSSSYYLAALACSDCGVLFSILFIWLHNFISVRMLFTDGWCKSYVYVGALCTSLSVWLIVAFTVERFIAVQYPLHRTDICTVRRAKIIVAIMMLLAIIVNLYHVWIVRIVRREDGSEKCTRSDDYVKVMGIISTIDTVYSRILPMVLVIFFNAMIIRNLLYSRCHHRANVQSKTTYPNETHSDIGHYEVNSTRPSQTSMSGIILSTIPDIGSSTTLDQVASRNQQQGITKMLLLISTVFILLNFPCLVTDVHGIFVIFTSMKSVPRPLSNLYMFFVLLSYTNFSINFLLYTLCGCMFRQCLKEKCKVVFNSMANLCGSKTIDN